MIFKSFELENKLKQNKNNFTYGKNDGLKKFVINNH